MREIGPAYEQGLLASIPGLIAQLDAAPAVHEADRGPEPELISPGPGGPLS